MLRCYSMARLLTHWDEKTHAILAARENRTCATELQYLSSRVEKKHSAYSSSSRFNTSAPRQVLSEQFWMMQLPILYLDLF